MGNFLESGKVIPAFLSSESGYFSELNRIFTAFDSRIFSNFLYLLKYALLKKIFIFVWKKFTERILLSFSHILILKTQ